MARLQYDRDAKIDLRQIVRYIGVEQMRPEAARKMARKSTATANDTPAIR